MTSIERMFSILQQNNKTVQSLCDHIDVTSSVVANWKNRNEHPPAKYIVTICEFLNVSCDYLLTGKESTESLSSKEKSLINFFRALDMNRQDNLLSYARDAAIASEAYKKDNTASNAENIS